MTYDFKLKPKKSQVQMIEMYLETCKKVYNYALRERKDWVNSRKSPINFFSIHSEYIISPNKQRPTYNSQCKSLTDAKKIYPQLKEPHSQVLQQTLRTLEAAFVNMWERGFGFPRFKKKMRSFLYPSVKQKWVGDGWVKLPKIGKVKMRMSRPISNGFVLKQIRVVKRASGYFVQLIYQLSVNIPETPIQGYPLGVDIGLDSYLATSEGELVKRPRFFNQLHGKLKSLQRRLKNKKKGSNNWQKLQTQIARVYQKIHDTRKDWHFKLAHHLCDQAGMMFVEDINFKAWAKGLFGKHTLDAGFGQFFNILSYICWKRDVYFLKVDKDYTSQICPNCNTQTGKKNLNNRIHNCPNCGYQTNRDVAASQVIRNRGLVAVQRGLGGFPHERLHQDAVGQPVNEIASGGVLSGSIFDWR
ncbi:RNA-guided endonuclease InsQ/TnpB family protein [Crocosphaera watsonii]|uniref:Transposase n=1 Tax=Crocosphaera watsonii WH 8502 TaxID=423474 RepID=T2IIP4_CROWT|nr:RNA-guided endonuclease TnpB family protein [Crocosphaera watsonii]CCQ53391.1 Transposase [Crocosphaera watsonii WH 8502]